MITVAYVVDDLGMGGAQRQLAELVCALPRRRFLPAVIALSATKLAVAPILERAAVPITCISHHGAWSTQTLLRVWRRLRDLRPDIVHTWMFTADLYGRLAARLARVPVVVSAVRSTEPDKPLHYVAVDRVLRHVTDAFTVNAAVIGDTLRRRERVVADRIHTIYNGVDLKTFTPTAAGSIRRELGLSDSAFVVALIGRLSPEKGQDLLLAAASRLRRAIPQLVMLIVGDGPDEQRLRARAKAEGLEGCVRFLPSRSPVTPIHAAMDLLVVPSRFEGCSNVILEAMAMGKPVVASAVGGNRELVVHGETGLLVEYGSVSALEGAILELVADPGRAAAMGRAGRLRAEAQFSLDAMIAATERLYQGLVAEHR